MRVIFGSKGEEVTLVRRKLLYENIYMYFIFSINYYQGGKMEEKDM
jgi:hypothetical protein